MQYQFRVPNSYDGFVRQQRHSWTVGQYDTPSVGPSRPAASTVVVHSGIPNSSGAVAINKTASIAEIRQLAVLRWLSVSSLKRRAREVGRCCVVVAAVQTPVCGAWPTLSRHATSELLSWLASGQRRAISLVSRAGAGNRQGDSGLAVQGDGGAASAYLLPQLFLWIGPRVFAYGPLQIR